ncbi:hypothetical protein V6N11_003763 [Hibiscus sabdariffa]|uniref:Uncharacterized protein n=1 Tax=Hibiscus sabdariffa TaxID=183260 RepID=A0ABR2SE68_9ROSI
MKSSWLLKDQDNLWEIGARLISDSCSLMNKEVDDLGVGRMKSYPRSTHQLTGFKGIECWHQGSYSHVESNIVGSCCIYSLNVQMLQASGSSAVEPNSSFSPAWKS